MDELFNDQLSPEQAATLREMERKSQDRIRVYNPTEKAYIIRWDSRGFRVPAKSEDIGYGAGQAVHPRYVARKYVKEMIELIVGQKRVQAIMDENQKRIMRGQAEMTHWQERQVFEDQFKDTDPSYVGRLAPILWLGVEEEYGMDDLLLDNEQRRDPRSTVDQILANLEKPAQKLEENVGVEDVLPPSASEQQTKDFIENNQNSVHVTPPVPLVNKDDVLSDIETPQTKAQQVAQKPTNSAPNTKNIDDMLARDPLTNVNPSAGSNTPV